MHRSNAVKILILIVLISAILLPAIFGEVRLVQGQSGGDPWRNFVLDFQTIIGGFLAVFAAWWTVSTMEKADQAAQTRHDQIIEATVFRDKRVLLRAKNHILENISNAKSFCSYFTQRNVAEIRAERPKTVTIRYNNALTFVAKLNKAFSDQDWIDAKYLLEPSLIAPCVELQNACDQFHWLSPSKEERFAPEFSPTDDQLEWLVGNNSILIVELSEQLEKALTQWKVV
ncbi:DUF1345 domain-containing protein [Rhizobium rhizophilum]|uniref:DUF1345 domain-containing protein n=1 Tax=Rhizobium rhizophilum TaxID=1850373 RepID=A0ABY2QWR3_9HYPH|nr:DUF1345 domain-containing protein [Rhizobium rhizophilum]THV15395.1 DUF1345 domain-containing protein [Rhizobium rhizophilum]